MIALRKKEIDLGAILGKQNKMTEWLAKNFTVQEPAEILCTRSKEQTKCLHDDTAEFPSWGLSAALAQLILGST